MNKKIAVITGTSSGLGLELALLLAKHDYYVYATMRNLDKQDVLLNRAKSESIIDNIEVVQLDVTNDTSIAKCFNKIIEKSGQVNLLVNNAGAGFIRSVEQSTLDEINWVNETNYMSVVKCVKAVIPQMRQQQSGHIINISSVGGLIGQPFNELYCGAKFAVEGFTEAMASYMTKGFNINFTLIEPGGIRSEFVKSALNNIEVTGGIYDDEYKSLLNSYIGNAATRVDASAYQTPAEVAKIILEQAINPQVIPLRIRTSEWSENLCKIKTSNDPDGLKLRKYVETKFI